MASTRPRFVRPTRADALEIAREMFVRGDRLDMQTLSAALGIGRTTLYRWVGDRERLIGEVLATLTDVAWDAVIAEAEGEGDLRSLDASRRFMELTSTYPPLRQFAEREPQLALRILLAPDGPVAERIRAGVRRAMTEFSRDEPVDDEFVEIAVQIGTALEWAPIAVGTDPDIERATRLIGTLFVTTRRARNNTH